MFKVILSNKLSINRRAIIARTDEYLSAIVTVEALVESLETDYGIFEQNVLEVVPSEHQIVAYHPNGKLWISIEKVAGQNDISTTFSIAASGEIVHRVSSLPFTGLSSLQDDEALEYLIKNEAYHLIQPKMKP